MLQVSLLKDDAMHLCTQEVKRLTAALEGNTTLEELTACHHTLSVDDAQCFASALRSNSTMRSLSVGHSSFGDEAIAALAEGLSGWCEQLEMSLLRAVNAHCLDVDDMDGWMPSKVFRVRGPCLVSHAMGCALGAGNSALQKLDLEGKGLGSAGTKALAHNIDADTGLKHLILTSSSLGDDGASAVAPALHNIAQVICQSSEVLLHNDDILYPPAYEIAKACSKRTLACSWAAHHARMRLQVELQHCNIGAAGVSSIAKAAYETGGSSSTRASAMSLPELAANGVLPKSEQETASNSRLRILRLDGNPAGPAAGKALLPLLGHVRELYISSMGLGDEGVPPSMPWKLPEGQTTFIDVSCLVWRRLLMHLLQCISGVAEASESLFSALHFVG